MRSGKSPTSSSPLLPHACDRRAARCATSTRSSGTSSPRTNRNLATPDFRSCPFGPIPTGEVRRLSAVLAAIAALFLGGAYASATTGTYDGAYQGTLSYTADVPGTGTVSGSAPLSLSVAGGGVSGSFTVPYYGTISFSGPA